MAKPHHNGMHQKVRAEVARQMTTTTTCAICHALHCPSTGKLLATEWDLAHDDERGGNTWLGPAHPYCNRSTARQSPRWGGRKSLRQSVLRVIGPGVTGLRRVKVQPIEVDDDDG